MFTSPFTSIRARLTAWYAAAFAVFELVFAVAGYGFVARATGARTDEDLRRTAAAVADALDAEQAAAQAFGAFPGRGVAAVVREFRLGDAAVAVLDRVTGAVVIAFEIPRGGAPVAGPPVDGPSVDGPSPGAAWRRRFAPPAPPDFRGVLVAAPPAPALATVRTAGAPVRLYTTPYLFEGHELTVGVSASLAAQQRTLAEARTALAVGAPLMLAAAVAGGYALARRSLRPVAAMTRRAAQISAGTLDARLPIADPRDELGRLAAVFNELLGRLEAAFAQQRRFVAEASHELRTPVAIIAGEAELALGRGARDAGELRAALAAVGQEAGRLQQIVGDLFLLARADAGERPRATEELYLADLVGEVAQAVRTLAARKAIRVVERVEGELPFRGDEGLLRRMLLNLLDNAIKYTPAGGAVTVTAARRRDATRPEAAAADAARGDAARGDAYVIEVADTGPGIPPGERARVFERFFRGSARGRDAEERGEARDASGAGAGLGLAIARWIAEAHGGRLTLARSGPEGSAFAVELPVPGDAAGAAAEPAPGVR